MTDALVERLIQLIITLAGGSGILYLIATRLFDRAAARQDELKLVHTSLQSQNVQLQEALREQFKREAEVLRGELADEKDSRRREAEDSARRERDLLIKFNNLAQDVRMQSEKTRRLELHQYQIDLYFNTLDNVARARQPAAWQDILGAMPMARPIWEPERAHTTQSLIPPYPALPSATEGEEPNDHE